MRKSIKSVKNLVATGKRDYFCALIGGLYKEIGPDKMVGGRLLSYPALFF